LPEEELLIMWTWFCEPFLSLGLDGGDEAFNFYASAGSKMDDVYTDLRDAIRIMSLYPSSYSSRNINGMNAPQQHGEEDASSASTENAFRWAFKSPIHPLFLPSLFRAFPESQIVITHRDDKQVIASLCKLMSTYTTIFQIKANKNHIARMAMNFVRVTKQRIIEYRRGLSPEQDRARFCDVDYEELVLDPIGTVQRVYQHFGLPISKRFLQSMKEHIQDNPQGKHGRHKYSLEEFGIRPEDVEASVNVQ